MAHTVDSSIQTPAHELRSSLDRAERQLPKLDASGVEAYLVQLDTIEALMAQVGANGIDLRTEQTRWHDLLRQIDRRARQIVSAANRTGGYAALRRQHAPAEGRWWHLDKALAERRRRALKRLMVTLGMVAVLLLAAGWAYQTWLAPDADTILYVETLNTVEQRVLSQEWDAALSAAETTLQTLPDNVDLLIWAAVVAERLGQEGKAAGYQERAQSLMSDQPAQFWVSLGSRRYQAGDLDGAQAAADAAAAIAPDEAQVYFLYGNIAEERKDLMTAYRAFEKAAALAEDANPQLAVVSKLRIGMLLQQMQAIPNFDSPATTPVEVTPATPAP
ncbi:MAG: hypothetical protein H3C34_24830 [Caldilineaceae bacterium]|nr:hypothetical protein [Caldilineaceae bacterium]